MRKTLESPVHNERCTPGLGMGTVKTAVGNRGMASLSHFHCVNPAKRDRRAA